MKNKKAQMKLIISIAILVASLVIIIGIWDMFFSKAEESTAESLCMGFNALRMRTKIEKGPISFHTVPLTCKTLDKVIPSDIYPQTKAGAMEEMRNLVAKCWWMFLEGAEQNAFAKDKLWPFGDAPCFTCYRFKIKRGIKDLDQITMQEFDQSLLDTTYLANIDENIDDCAPIGGGKCISTEHIDGKRCNPPEPYKKLKLVVASNKCNKTQKCCISSKSNECENKGGICQDLDPDKKCRDKSDKYTQQYDKWSCRTGTCCIKDDNYYNYLDYIQTFRGDGVILYALKDQKFEPEKEQYAITFISPHAKCGWGCKALLGVAAVGTAGAIVGLTILTAGGTIPLWVAGAGALIGTGAGTAAVGTTLTYMTKHTEINAIMISQLDAVQTQCAIEDDTTGT